MILICQRCAFRYDEGKLFKEGKTGFYVCWKCLDPLHPQDMIKVRPEKTTTRAYPDNTTITVEAEINTDTQTDIPSGTFNSNNNTI